MIAYASAAGLERKRDDLTHAMELVLIAGLSGSGKSVALKALEDAGYYCVDNLPLPLLPDTAAYLAARGRDRASRSALDVKTGPASPGLPQPSPRCASTGWQVRFLFLDAKTDTLVQRFSETRRRHPSRRRAHAAGGDRARARAAGRRARRSAPHRHERALAARRCAPGCKEFVSVDPRGLTLLFQSFGYKHGVPLDADIVFDVRCLPNPHYEPELRRSPDATSR